MCFFTGIQAGQKRPRKNQSAVYLPAFMVFIFYSLFWMIPVGMAASSNGAAFEGKPIHELAIEFEKNVKKKQTWTALVQDLLMLKQGDLFSNEKMSRSIAALSESGLFEKIHVPDPKVTEKGVSLALILSVFDRIKKIRITGAFPVFEKEILKVMTISVGDAFIKETIEDQRHRIVSFFEKEGYVKPQVTIKTEQDPSDGHYTIFIDIDKGPVYTISEVRLSGNHHLSSTLLKLKTKTGTPFALFGGKITFKKNDVQADIKKILHEYWNRGFADAQVSFKTEPGLKINSFNIVFSIVEGPLYKFVLNGNKVFDRSSLEREIVVLTEGNKHGFGIKKSMRNMREKYQAKGYPDVKISQETKNLIIDDTQVRQVIFHIDEGAQYLISTFSIKGNAGLDTRLIKQQVLTGNTLGFGSAVYNKKLLEQDLNAIRLLYLNQGYTRARVEKSVKISLTEPGKAETGKAVAVEIQIQEGPQTRIQAVQFQGLTSLTTKQAMDMIGLKPGSLFRPYMIESDENILKTALSEKGYPHVEIDTKTDISPDGALASIRFQIMPGPLVRMGQVMYLGNFRTLDSILDRELEWRPSFPLSLTGLVGMRRNLMDIQALDSVRFKTLGLKEKKQSVDLVVEMQEKIPYYFEFGVGYDTRRLVYAETALGDHNFLGRNLNFETAFEISQIGYKSTLSLYEPRFLGSRISSYTRGVVEKEEELNKDFGIRAFGVSQEFLKTFYDEKLTLTMAGSLRSHEQYATSADAQVDQTTEAYDTRQIAMISPSLVLRTTDSYVRPKKGILATANIDLSYGLNNDLDNFVKYRMDSRAYFTPADPLTLAFRVKYGLIQTYGNTSDIPEDQLFFLGGTSSVRGFDENLLRLNENNKAVGGKQMMLGSIEARVDIRNNLELAGFFDAGSVSRAMDLYGSDDFRLSVGGGLRYITPIGPISLLYGRKLDPKPGESSGSFHFSMGYTF